MSTQVRERTRFDLRSLSGPSLPFTLRPAEMIAAGLALGLVVLVILYYFFYLAPVKDRLSEVEKENAVQLNALKPNALGPKSGPSRKEQIQQAKDSLTSFESDDLRSMAQGRIDLINEINQLAKADNVRLGSGIEMHVVYGGIAANSESQGSKKQKDSNVLDVFPRVQFQFAVKGEYKNLRKFLRDLEGSRQYVVIDSLNLTNAEQKQGRSSSRAPQMPQLESGSGLSLTVGMNAYFRQ